YPQEIFMALKAKSFDGTIVTPSGTPLGGWVHLEVESDGNYRVKFHMHSSSIFGNFDFHIRAYLIAPGAPAFFFHWSGHVSGVDDANHEDAGNNPYIRYHWIRIEASEARLDVSKDYTWGGVVGALDSVVREVVEVGAGAAGFAVGGIISVSSTLTGWT